MDWRDFMKSKYKIIFLGVGLFLFISTVSADRLPSEVAENQLFTIDTLIDATGIVSEESELDWQLDNSSKKLITARYIPGVSTLSSISDNMKQIFRRDGIYFRMMKHEWIPGEFLEYIEVPEENKDYISFPYGLEKYSKFQIDSKNRIDGISQKLFPYEEIAILTWSDTLRSNGGEILLNKNIDFDSRNKENGQFNLNNEKVLTYVSTEGSHLVGSEEWTLDVAGHYESNTDKIRCVFASTADEIFPAFCNVVKAKSEIINMNNGKISTKGSSRAIADSNDIPASLNYQIAVTPNSYSGEGFADGTVKTLFSGSIMEARNRNNNQSATNTWKDSASVTGGITQFQKAFNYESGIQI